MIIVSDIQQGTDEWKQLRAGVITASKLHNVISAVRGDYSKSADKYAIKLIAEKLTGEIDEEYSNPFMERGITMEEEARNWYEFTTGREVRQVGFIFKDDQHLVGCSPDGLMDDRGLEVKCVIGSTMVSYLLGSEETVINEYKQQIQGSMYVTGLSLWDLVIYHPCFDPILITVKRDDEYIRCIEIAIARLLREINEKIERIKS
jgi:putative phage-type endonuclease